MNITYQREVSHCEPSPYIKLVTIKSVEPAQNSDRLDRVKFEEVGWNVISQRGLRAVGQQVLFIPPDSVLPFELTEALEITPYTSKGRIKATNLRGNRSEGIIVEPELVEPYLPYIMKWEDLPTPMQLRGDAISSRNTPSMFSKFYKMPNILNEPLTFEVGENIWVSEKIHGTNFRFGRFQNPETGEYDNYVGSHNVVLKYTNAGNLYWAIFDKYFKGRIREDIVYFAEIYGPGVQHLDYGLTEPNVAIFSMMWEYNYLNPIQVMEHCVTYELPVVSFHRMVFKDIEEFRSLADSPSEVTDKHGREGIVIVSDEHPDKMAKCIGFDYLTNKKSGKNRTERH